MCEVEVSVMSKQEMKFGLKRWSGKNEKNSSVWLSRQNVVRYGPVCISDF